MFSTVITQTITVGRQPSRDRFGDAVGEPVTHTIEHCVGWPTDSTEAANRSDSVTTTDGLLVPAGSDIHAADVVWLEGDDPADRPPWQVHGEPGAPESPFTGWRPGLLVALHRYEG